MYGLVQMSKPKTVLQTPAEVIDALGGTNNVALLIGHPNLQMISNWKMEGRRIPPEWCFPISRLLAAQGKTADPVGVFGMRP
jgi:hypothetical protein